MPAEKPYIADRRAETRSTTLAAHFCNQLFKIFLKATVSQQLFLIIENTTI